MEIWTQNVEISYAKSIFLDYSIFIHVLGIFGIESDFNIVHILFSSAWSNEF